MLESFRLGNVAKVGDETGRTFSGRGLGTGARLRQRPDVGHDDERAGKVALVARLRRLHGLGAQYDLINECNLLELIANGRQKGERNE